MARLDTPSIQVYLQTDQKRRSQKMQQSRLSHLKATRQLTTAIVQRRRGADGGALYEIM